MFRWNTRRDRRSGRDRFRPDFELGRAALEGLEPRELMAYSVLGQSLPDLVIKGFASPAASWGRPLTVTVDVSNIGASTIIEPLALPPGSVSSADAGPSTVSVFAVRNPHSLRGAVQVATFDFPAVPQNTTIQTSETIVLPPRPIGFPGDGGKIYLIFKANSTGTVYETDGTNNFSARVPVQIVAPLPELAVVGFDVPPVMQPGDVIQPNVRVANFGPANTLPQGPVAVSLVASTSPQFLPGFSSIIATQFVPNIPGVQNVANEQPVFADANQSPQQNVVTIPFSPVKLPTGPATYYLGVVIDPLNTLKQLENVGGYRPSKNRFSLPQLVGPPIYGLPPASQLVPGGAANVPTFPTPFGGLPVGGSLDGTFPAPYPPPSPAALITLATPATGTTTGVSATAAAVTGPSVSQLGGGGSGLMHAPVAAGNTASLSGSLSWARTASAQRLAAARLGRLQGRAGTT